MSARPPYSRASFDAQLARGRAVEREAGRRLAGIAVGLGVGQLLFLRWADTHLEKSRVTAIAGSVFLMYAAAVAWSLRDFLRRQAAERPRCPACDRAFDDTSRRIVSATGHCDGCGAEVIR